MTVRALTKSTLRLSIILLISGIVIGYNPSHSSATSLKEILEGKSIEKIDRENRALDQMSKPTRRKPVSPWINTHTNYGKLITNGLKASMVLHWLFGSVDTYKPLKPKFMRDAEVSTYNTPIAKGKVRKAMDFKLLIPHPKFRESVEYGLIKQFNQLTPPERLVLSHQKVTVGRTNSAADLYQLKRKTCVILIDVAKNSKIQLVQPGCQNAEELLGVANKIDIARLNRKLNS